jgi:high-affinity iron transporter
MPAVALLVFREVLEAALIISVVCAATRGVPRRGSFVLGGIGLGVMGALLVAVGADYIASLAGGAGQDIFNAGVLLSAVVMIGWHVVWMSSHGRELAEHMRSIGGAVKAGSRSLTLLLTVVALAVLREGSEIVLFLYGMAAGGIGRRRDIGLRTLLRPAADSDQALLRRHQRHVDFIGRGTFIDRRRVPGAERSIAYLGQPDMEYLSSLIG